MARRRQWHISGLAAILLAPVLLPAAVLVRLWPERSGSRTSVRLTAADVAGYIDDFLNDRGRPWDWDDFTSIPIADPRLDGIRREAEMVRLPAGEPERAQLASLRDRALNLS